MKLTPATVNSSAAKTDWVSKQLLLKPWDSRLAGLQQKILQLLLLSQYLLVRHGLNQRKHLLLQLSLPKTKLSHVCWLVHCRPTQ